MSKIETPHSESDTERECVPNTNRPRGILATLVYGGLIIAGLLLMLAPRFWKRTRANIQQKGIEPHDQASEATDDAMAVACAKAQQVEYDADKDAPKLQHRDQEMLDEQMANVSAAVEAGGLVGR